MSASLAFHQVTVSRGPQLILHQVDFRVSAKQCAGVVGPNGVGKSTLLAAAAGAITVDEGTVEISPGEATIGWLHQEPDRSDETVRELLARRTGVADAQAELDATTTGLAEGDDDAADRYDLALQRWLALGAADLDSRVGAVADDLGMATQLLDQSTEELSGGEAARAGLAALVLSRFDIYLLDEPTNDLDLAGLARLEQWVNEVNAPVLLVSHDRRFLERTVTDVVEIDEFSHQITQYGGGWESYRNEREVLRQQAWQNFNEYDTQRQGLAKRAQQQREWADQGQSKVTKSGEQDKFIRHHRTSQSEQLAGKAASTKRAAERLEAVAKPREPWQLHLDIPSVGRSGDMVVRLNGVVVERPGFTLGPVDLMVGYGDRIALMGSNGAGKSTLIDLMVGRLSPDGGQVQLGSSVVVGEIEQVRGQLTDAESLVRSFTDQTGMLNDEARTLLAKFGLFDDHVTRPTNALSPGERTRAALALLMANGANLLVLDEPTNHLDLPAIEQLEKALATFEGTVIVVSHDREFLKNVELTRTIRVKDGQLEEAR